jgi:hypothetical protein
MKTVYFQGAKIKCFLDLCNYFLGISNIEAFQEVFGTSQIGLLFVLWHLVKGLEEHTQARILAKKAPLCMHESPKECVPRFLPRAFGEVAHLHEVVATTYIGLGSHQSAISKLAHTIYIWHHYPIIRIYKQLHEPSIYLIWVKLAQKHKVAQDHKPLNVMAIACFMGKIPVLPVQNEAGIFLLKPQKFVVRSFRPSLM